MAPQSTVTKSRKDRGLSLSLSLSFFSAAKLTLLHSIPFLILLLSLFKPNRIPKPFITLRNSNFENSKSRSEMKLRSIRAMHSLETAPSRLKAATATATKKLRSEMPRRRRPQISPILYSSRKPNARSEAPGFSVN